MSVGASPQNSAAYLRKTIKCPRYYDEPRSAATGAGHQYPNFNGKPQPTTDPTLLTSVVPKIKPSDWLPVHTNRSLSLIRLGRNQNEAEQWSWRGNDRNELKKLAAQCRETNRRNQRSFCLISQQLKWLDSCCKPPRKQRLQKRVLR